MTKVYVILLGALGLLAGPRSSVHLL